MEQRVSGPPPPPAAAACRHFALHSRLPSCHLNPSATFVAGHGHGGPAEQQEQQEAGSSGRSDRTGTWNGPAPRGYVAEPMHVSKWQHALCGLCIVFGVLRYCYGRAQEHGPYHIATTRVSQQLAWYAPLGCRFARPQS